MSLSNRQRAVGAVAYGMVRGMTEGEIVDRLSDDGPSPPPRRSSARPPKSKPLTRMRCS